MQRIEPFLDISLPIVNDEGSKLDWAEESFGRKQYGRSCKKSETPAAKGGKKATPTSSPVTPAAPVNAASVDSVDKRHKKSDFLSSLESTPEPNAKLSKHQLKKMAKQNKKSSKVVKSDFKKCFLLWHLILLL